MGWLSSVLRMLAPIAMEHGGQVLRDSLKSRAAQGREQAQPPGPDPIQQLAVDMEQLKSYVLQLKCDLDVLNNTAAAREDKLRKWLLALVIWNIAMTLGLVVLVVAVLRH